MGTRSKTRRRNASRPNAVRCSRLLRSEVAPRPKCGSTGTIQSDSCSSRTDERQLIWNEIQDRLQDDCPDGVNLTYVGAYRYSDKDLNPIHYTSVPLNHKEALARFKKIMRFGRAYHPVFVERCRPGQATWEMLPYFFDETTGTTKPLNEFRLEV